MSYTLIFRRYAPFDTFGGGFHGDGRTSPDFDGTARTTAEVVFDMDAGAPSASGSSGESFHSWMPSVRRTGETKVEISALVKAGNRLSFTAHSYGSLPLIPGAPDIDTFVDLSAESTSAGLRVFGTVRGDDFPNAEVFVFDNNRVSSKPSAVWHFETTGGQNTGPMMRLPGANSGQLLGSFVATV